MDNDKYIGEIKQHLGDREGYVLLEGDSRFEIQQESIQIVEAFYNELHFFLI